MPGGDNTGPQGQGPQTGRGAGFCAGYSTPGSANPNFGMGGGGGRGGFGGGGFGRGGGRRGRRNRFQATGMTGGMQLGQQPGGFQPGNQAPVEANQNVGFLKAQANRLQQMLQSIQNQILALESTSNEKED